MARHQRERFYKYTSAETAFKVIESGTVRYSSPILFNDPFDVQSGLHFDFDIDALPNKLFERMSSLVRSDTRPVLPVDDPFCQAILYMWDKKATHGFPADELWKLIQPPLADLTAQIDQFRSQYQGLWWNDFLPRLRVFSVAEERDNLLMWSHYAKSHTGVVFSFRVLPDEDNPICVADPVIYEPTPPILFSEAEWIEHILGIRLFNPSDIYWRYAKVKSDVWAYEQEWRVWDLLPTRTEQLWSDYPLRTNEVEAIYFGCRVGDFDKAKIMSTIAMKYPRAQLFQARKPIDAFRLEFHAA